MNTETLTRPTAAKANCGCGGASQAYGGAGGCSCGGAGCGACTTRGIARPRFFAGQLLTDDDLQALADYVLQKQRLHNRHFVGDGVVCGLQVSCNPCGGGKLVVQPGHAVDCCGNDLVLECPVELDANALVRELRRNLLGGYDCGDPCAGKQGSGGKQDDKAAGRADARHYALYAVYREEASDPVAPYATEEPCGSASCEPTRIREGVRFELRCRVEAAAPDGLLQRAAGCLRDVTRAEVLASALAKLNDGGTREDVATVKEALLDYLDASPRMADCALRGDVARIAVPATSAPAEVQPARKQLTDAYVRLLRDCLCNALLPPCPPCEDPAVLLATIEIADCEVIDICNLARKFVLTGPNLRYWFPLDLVGDLLEQLCCCEPCEDEPAATPAPTSAPKDTSTPQGEAVSVMVAPAPQPAPQPGTPPPQKTPAPAVKQTPSAPWLADVQQLRSMAARRMLRQAPAALDIKDLVSRQVMDSPAFRNLAAELRSDQARKLDAARQEILANNAKATQSVVDENRALRSELDLMKQRVSKLETAPAPAAGDDGTRRKK